MEPGLAKVVKKSKNQQAWHSHQTGFGLKVAELGLVLRAWEPEEPLSASIVAQLAPFVVAETVSSKAPLYNGKGGRLAPAHDREAPEDDFDEFFCNLSVQFRKLVLQRVDVA